MSSKKKSAYGNIYYKNISKAFADFLHRKQYSTHFILVDENTGNHCLPVLLREMPRLHDASVIEIFAGESFKNIESVQQVWEQLTEQRADRKSVLINLGGGMVCDLGGFAAATYKRGIDFIHVPTTLLSQTDAAYGGKQGIDFHHYKNQVGVFKEPAATFVKTGFLATLPAEQLINGFAEVVKHGLLAGGKFWKRVQSIDELSTVKWEKIVADSSQIKLSVVEKDPFEKGFRKILNFGHTIGHSIETNLLNRGEDALHGFCIAAGMTAELFLSVSCCGLSEKKMLAAVALLHRHFPPVKMDPAFDDVLLELMKQDKKNRGGQVQFALLKDIGEPVINVGADEKLIRQSLDYMRSVFL